MKNTLILMAGYPATGKTCFCQKILEEYPGFVQLSPDELKEGLWEQYGFDNMEEKAALEKESWELYYTAMERQMKTGTFLISDYPFSDKQKERIRSIAERNDYQVITIRLVGDIDTLYRRSKMRDLSPSRHLGHIVSRYHKGDVLKDRNKADALVTYDIFKERCALRGYDRFELGYLIEVDVTDFDMVRFSDILGEIRRLMTDSWD